MAQQYTNINVSDLKLDLYNPRLPKSKQGKDEKTVIEYMLLEAATLELMLAIAENGFFAGELLLVIKDSVEKDKFIVIEGNRRLTAVKLLNDPTIANVKSSARAKIIENVKCIPKELPCLVFDNKNDILKYLGFRHITGIKSWRLLEKARYLHELRNGEDFKRFSFIEVAREIAKIIGSNAAYVKKLLVSFELYKIVEDDGFFQIDGLDDTRFYLNYFTDGLNKENIRNFINVNLNSETPLADLNRDSLKKLVGWWFKETEGQSRVLGDSEGLKVLNSVLGHTVALSAFEKGMNIYEAYELTGDIDLQFEKKIKESSKSIEQAFVLIPKVSKFYNELYEDLKTIRKIAGNINEIKMKMEQNGDDF